MKKFNWKNLIILLGGILILFGFSYWVKEVFKGKIQIDPIAFSFGPFKIYWYGILIATSFLIGFLLILKEAKKRNYNQEHLINLVFWGTLAGFLGARTIFVLLQLNYFIQNPLEIFKISKGGLSIHGALLFGFIAIYLYCLKYKLSFLKFADLFTPFILLGQGISRWGNFINQELIGYPTNLPWKMWVKEELRPKEFISYSFFHPVFLYESIICLLGFLIFYYLLSKKIRSGSLFFGYILYYSIGRFLVEIFRIEPRIIFHLSLAQIVSIGLIIISLICLLKIKKSH